MIMKDDMIEFKKFKPGSKIRSVLLRFEIKGVSEFLVYDGNNVSEESVFEIKGEKASPTHWAELFTTRSVI